MFCNNCGKELSAESRFCSNCGTSIPITDNYKKKSSNITFEAIKLTSKITLAPVTIPFSILKWSLGIRTLKCPRCSNKKINKMKPGWAESAIPGFALLALGPLGLLAGRPKTLFVCKQCGFSWER